MSEVKRAALEILATARQATDFEESASDVYLKFLERFSDEEVTAACIELGARPRAGLFTSPMPAAGDICEVIQLARVRAAEERGMRQLMAAREEEERRYRCPRCEDTGWEFQLCPGPPNSQCGHKNCYPHSFVTPCACGRRGRFAA